MLYFFLTGNQNYTAFPKPCNLNITIIAIAQVKGFRNKFWEKFIFIYFISCAPNTGTKSGFVLNIWPHYLQSAVGVMIIHSLSAPIASSALRIIDMSNGSDGGGLIEPRPQPDIKIFHFL